MFLYHNYYFWRNSRMDIHHSSSTVDYKVMHMTYTLLWRWGGVGVVGLTVFGLGCLINIIFKPDLLWYPHYWNVLDIFVHYFIMLGTFGFQCSINMTLTPDLPWKPRHRNAYDTLYPGSIKLEKFRHYHISRLLNLKAGDRLFEGVGVVGDNMSSHYDRLRCLR